MKFITCDTTFKDGRDTYHAGERRLVDDDKAAYFAAHKWARLEGSAPTEATEPTPEVVVQPADSIHNQAGG